MNYREFKKRIKDFPIFSSSQLNALPGDLQVLRNQLSHWRKRGLLVKLKRGLYLLNREDRKFSPSRVFIAGQLLSPSYVSTQYALTHYGLIPERTADVTSITTKKTAAFSNEFGVFTYQHLKLSCFNGFREEKDENGLSYFMAEPEKALIDFFYLNFSSFPAQDLTIFEKSYRFRKEARINIKKLRNYARAFGNKKLLRITENFCQYLRS